MDEQQCFSPLKRKHKKNANLLGDADNESSKFATRMQYVINDQNNTGYGEGTKDSATVKFESKVIKSSFCENSDAYIFVTGDITAEGGNENTKVAFKNCAPFKKCITHINDEHADNADNLDILMHMYNLTEYSDHYLDTSGNVWQFKKDEQNTNNGNPVNIFTANSTPFKYKSSFFKPADNNGVF